MKIIAVTGPTATGKTALAVRLARCLDGEVISADSRQVYKGLDIGSGKDLAEYGNGENRIPCHLIDIADPADTVPYTLADFMGDAKAAIRDIASRNRVPILCGGTGLYLHALIKGYELPGGPADRELRNRLACVPVEELAAGQNLENGEDTNRYRLSRKEEIRKSGQMCASGGGPLENAEYLVIGSYRPRAEVRARIEKRLDERFSQGMTDEVKRLHDENGVPWAKLESFGLEYGKIARFLQDGTPFETMREELLTAIRRFAKRQDTWFRKMEKEGIPIYWLSPENTEDAEKLCRSFLAGEKLSPPECGLPKNTRSFQEKKS